MRKIQCFWRPYKTYQNKTYQNKTYHHKTYQNKTYHHKTYQTTKLFKLQLIKP